MHQLIVISSKDKHPEWEQFTFIELTWLEGYFYHPVLFHDIFLCHDIFCSDNYLLLHHCIHVILYLCYKIDVRILSLIQLYTPIYFTDHSLNQQKWKYPHKNECLDSIIISRHYKTMESLIYACLLELYKNIKCNNKAVTIMHVTQEGNLILFTWLIWFTCNICKDFGNHFSKLVILWYLLGDWMAKE